MRFILNHPFIKGILFLGLLTSAVIIHAEPAKNEEAFTFTTWNKQTADGFEGFFKVPENRGIPKSRSLKVHYVVDPEKNQTPASSTV
ncbi:hypothetical protein [Microbulbifer variabilis]|uniref:hypothetical protein n=1 Tax=Microbulbifer variabilis TaxID=266805 RepID=UPI001CFC7671|nr:hypothetical protein [Microbulbifer variabilis]